jgi:hypothetical protein
MDRWEGGLRHLWGNPSGFKSRRSHQVRSVLRHSRRGRRTPAESPSYPRGLNLSPVAAPFFSPARLVDRWQRARRTCWRFENLDRPGRSKIAVYLRNAAPMEPETGNRPTQTQIHVRVEQPNWQLPGAAAVFHID